nr:hypothetical protein [Tanacetum cinerariifolium]
MKHNDNNHDGKQPNKKVCRTEMFEAIKYSLGPNEEYIAVRRCEYDTLERNEDNMSQIYQEIFSEKGQQMEGREIYKVYVVLWMDPLLTIMIVIVMLHLPMFIPIFNITYVIGIEERVNNSVGQSALDSRTVVVMVGASVVIGGVGIGFVPTLEPSKILKPTIDLVPESKKSASEIHKIKKEQVEKQKMTKYTVNSTDKAALKEYDLKNTLYQTMNENKSFNRNPANHALY